MADQPQPRRRRKRKWLLFLGGAAALLLILIAILPMLVSAGLGHGIIRNAINGSINGTVEFNALRLSWFGQQRVEGLTLTGRDGKQAANLNVDVHAGLFQIVTRRPGTLDVTLAGTVSGEVREDGTLSFQDLMASNPAMPKPPPPAPSAKPFSIASIPPTTVNISGLAITLDDLRTKRKVALNGLAGKIAYVDALQPITVDLKGTTLADGVAGTVALTGHADNLFAADGALSLKGASAKVDGKVESVPLPFAMPGTSATATLQDLTLTAASDDLTGRIVMSLHANGTIEGQPASSVNVDASVSNAIDSHGKLSLKAAAANITAVAKNLPIATGDLQGFVQQFKATVVSNDLTQTVVVAIDSNAQLQGHDASTFTASVSVDKAFTPDGKFDLKPEHVTGTVQGTAVPTAVIQPMLAKTPFVVVRDVGPLIDLNASFSAGETRNFTVVANSPPTQFEAAGVVNTETGTIDGTRMLLSAVAHPDLVKSLSGVVIDRPTTITVNLDSFAWPAADPASKKVPLSQVAARGVLNVKGITTLHMPSSSGEAREITAGDVQVRFDSPGLGDHVNLEGTATVEGAACSINERIASLFNAAGELDLINAKPVGSVTVKNLSAATVSRFAPKEQAALVNEVVGNSLYLDVKTAETDAGLTATVNAAVAAGNVSVTATRSEQSLGVLGGQINLNLTPKLFAALQGQAENAIVLAQPAAVMVSIQSLDLPATGSFSYDMPKEPIRVNIETPSLILNNLPSFTEPINISAVTVEVATEIGSGLKSIKINGDATLLRASNNQHIANSRYNILVETERQPWKSTADISLGDVAVANLEPVLGMEPGGLAQWTGPAGHLVLNVQSAGETYLAKIHTQMPLLVADFTANSDGSSISVFGNTSTFLLSRATLEKRLNAPGADGKPPPPENSIRVQEDVPLTMSIKSLRLPAAMLKRQPFDPKAFALDMTLKVGLLGIINPGDIRTTVKDLDVKLSSADLADGVRFAVRGQAEAAVPAAPPPPGAAAKKPAAAAGGSLKSGTLEANGKLVDLINDKSILDTANATVQMTASAKNIPSALGDAFAKLQGLLVAAVGPLMSATVNADRFSSNTGKVESRIETTNGWVETTVLGKEKSYRINNANPFKAELTITPPLRERLLYKIHPVLADIRTTEQPLRISIPWVVAPVGEDGSLDISKLNANMEITVGKVEIDSGSTTLFLLKFVGQDKKRQTVPGNIEPIIAKIRNGIVTYDRFAMQIDHYTLVYSGQIDLVQQTVDLRTEIPLAGLAHTFHELEGIADKIVVPMVTRGKFGETKTSIDPGFDMGKEAVKAGFKGGAEKIIGDLLNRIKKN